MGLLKMVRATALILISAPIFSCQMHQKPIVSKSVVKTAKDKLQYALENSAQWEKVHAAEYILNLDYSNNVHDIFVEEEKQNRNEPYYRIGIWRVLNQAATATEEKKRWLDSISSVFEKYTYIDRVHAAESLAKLKVSPNTISFKVTDSILKSAHNPLWGYTYWGTAYTSEADMPKVKKKFMDIILKSDEPTSIKRIALYALYKMKDISVQNWDLLISRTLKEATNSPLYTSLLTCTLANTPADSLLSSRVLQCREMLNKQLYSLKNNELAAALAVYQDIATEEDLPFLISYMEKGIDEENTEITMAAANAILGLDSEER
ncbi:hypothetical protein [Arenibacter algicola]|uniref:HEAT repeat domain-containing protein n=1 Tax=Arenibacter algicola TaxID=616991 RepID=A0A221UTH8_9FLAO|nr:hypothetical protein [Arenibacter algicola]ASO04622.1 hypothetical protein AREALGSMS7_01147 [Arenibacter algicola]